MPSKNVLSVALSAEEMAQLEALCATPYGVLSKSEVVRQALYEFAERRKSTS